MWDFVVDKVALGLVFSEYFGFPGFIPPIAPKIIFIYHRGLYKGQSGRSTRD
jgi:hypothetical protein